MSKRGHVPLRTCIGCRRKRKKEEMLRLTQRSDGIAGVDVKRVSHGRGLYLCPDPVCLEKARKRNRSVRFLVSAEHWHTLPQSGVRG